jgi:membrane fusion protein, multidrug efflux system
VSWIGQPRLLGLAVVGPLLFALLLGLERSDAAAAAAGEGLTVNTVLSPLRQAVLSAEVAGAVEQLNVELGSAFAAGDLLVALDSTPHAARRDAAAAKLSAAEEQLEQTRQLHASGLREQRATAVLEAARENLAALEEMYAANNASRIDLANARRDVATAYADLALLGVTAAQERIQAERDVAIAREELRLAEEALADCRFVAPFAGRVARVFVAEHETVQRHQPVVEVIDDRVLLAKFLAPTSAFAELERGREVAVRVQETGTQAVGVIVRIAPTFDAVSKTVEVHARIENADARLRAGMNGRVRLPARAEPE